MDSAAVPMPAQLTKPRRGCLTCEAADSKTVSRRDGEVMSQAW